MLKIYTKTNIKVFRSCLTLFNFLFCLKDFKQIVDILQELLPLEINKYKSLTCWQSDQYFIWSHWFSVFYNNYFSK